MLRGWVCRTWFIHKQPSLLELTGLEMKEMFSRGGDINIKGWMVVSRLLRQLESKMYRGSDRRWRHIFDPMFAVRVTEKNNSD
jgi:hypothetical protein